MGWWKKIQKLNPTDFDPFNKNSEVREQLAKIDKNALQPLWDLIKDPLEPVAQEYIRYIEKQVHGYKPLPRWLKLVLQELDAYDVDVTAIGYAENIDTLQDGFAVTIGNNIHFPGAINLGENGPGSEGDVKTMLHELEHVVQYKRHGGVTSFLLKYVVQAGVGSLESLQKIGKSWKDFVLKVHDNMDLEKDADSKADSLIDRVMWEGSHLSLGRTTLKRRNLGSRVILDNATMYEGDFMQSENGLYEFICQADGNVVMYGPGYIPFWSSSTDGIGSPPYRIVAQDDGNVVQYGRHNAEDLAIWRTGTRGLEGQVLILQDDRNLVIYASGNRPVWQSRTYLGA